MAGFQPLIPTPERTSREDFSPYRGGDSGFVRMGSDGESAPDPRGEEPPVARPHEGGPAPELPRPPVQDVASMLLEAEHRGRALAQAELQSMRREVEGMRAALEREKADFRRILQGIHGVEDQMKAECRHWFGEVLLAATRRVVSCEASREAVFRNRLTAVADQLILEKEVTLFVPPAFGDLARSLLRGHEGWTVVEDATLDGGCRAECRSGSVDGSIRAALEGLDEAVREWLSQGAEGEAP